MTVFGRLHDFLHIFFMWLAKKDYLCDIGTWAGLVWNALNDAQKAMNLKDLRKATKLKVNEMHCALGWLAKEGKLNFAEGKDDIEVSLR